MIKRKRGKVERNQRLYDFWKSHPTWSYKAIANMFHITQPRAWKIIYDMDKVEREQASLNDAAKAGE